MVKKNLINRSRELQANERTFLAWVRTSIALMGFGFLIVKFALFLKEMTHLLEHTEVPLKEFSPNVGIVMVLIGFITAILAFIQYKRSEYLIKNEHFTTSPILTLFIFLVILMGGIVMILYLTSII